MTVLDGAALFGPGKFPRKIPHFRVRFGSLVGIIALGAGTLVLGAILLRGFSENGFRLGSQLAWRYTSLVFFACMVAGPVCRMAARVFPDFSVPERFSAKLIWGFCASYAIYLLSVFLPNVIRLSAGATLMVVFGGSVMLVMAAAAAPLKRLGDKPVIPEKVRRTLLGTAVIYFWLCYSVMALARISGPHRPDAYYDISLCLMIAALLVRYADNWFALRQLPADQAPMEQPPRTP
jgi:hypothetical protein